MRPRLQFLSTGSAVRELQALPNQRLHGLLPALVTDGKFGEMTLQRVRAFQKQRGLFVDGVAGPVTPSGWSPAGQWKLVNNFPSIDRSSVLMCGYGGVISIA